MCVLYLYVFERLSYIYVSFAYTLSHFEGVGSKGKTVKTQILARGRMRLNAEPNQFVLPLERPPSECAGACPPPGINRKAFLLEIRTSSSCVCIVYVCLRNTSLIYT